MSESKACPECRHIYPSGARCHAPALRGKPLCYYHSRNRTLVDHNRYRQRSVALPPLEDRAGIQIAINEVVAAITAQKISDRTAGRLLYAIQLASQNLTRAKEEQLAARDAVEMYEDIFEEPTATDVPEAERASESSRPSQEAAPSARAVKPISSTRSRASFSSSTSPPTPPRQRLRAPAASVLRSPSNRPEPEKICHPEERSVVKDLHLSFG